MKKSRLKQETSVIFYTQVVKISVWLAANQMPLQRKKEMIYIWQCIIVFNSEFCFWRPKNENKKYWFIYDLNWKCAHLFSFDATELKIAPKSLKVFEFTEKNILKHFFWFLNFVKKKIPKTVITKYPHRLSKNNYFLLSFIF